MAENTNIPKLRFKGFSDDWQQRKWNKIVTRINESSSSQILPKLEFEDIISGFGSLNKDISNKFDSRKGILFRSKNILFGKLRPYLQNWLFPNFNGIALGDFWVFEAQDGAPEFAYYLLQSDTFQRVANDTSGTKMPRSDWKMVSETAFLIPSTEAEQQLIGNLFQTLDSLITAQKRKIELLKQLKKGYLQKIFSQQIRFSGFTQSWNVKAFSDLYVNITEKNDLSFGPDKIISVAKMYFKSNASKSDEEYMKTYNVMRLGDIAFEGNKSKNFAYGRFVENTIGDGIISHVFIVFRPIVEYDLYFWKYLINHENIMGRILKNSTTKSTMMTNIVTKDFLKQRIMLPSAGEQNLIGQFFQSLDLQISLADKKLATLTELKKSYLQQMFV